MFGGVFDLNTYATDYIVDNESIIGRALITRIAVGGAVQKYIFSGKMPDNVIAKYQRLVGFPSVPPEWAFGWQHSKDGVVSGEDWSKIAAGYKEADLPLDALWATADIMEDFKTFTVSDTKYKGFKALVTALQKWLSQPCSSSPIKAR